MQAFVIDTKTVLQPFEEPVGDCLIVDRPLKEYQREILENSGFRIVPIPASGIPEGNSAPCLILQDNLFLTGRLLEEFIGLAKAKNSGCFRLWIRKGNFTRLLAILQETEETADLMAFPLWYSCGGRIDTTSAEKIIIDIDEDSYEGNFPSHMLGKESYKFCVTSRPAMTITHPLQLALANIAANFARLAELKRMSIFGKIFTVLKARSLNKFRILGAVSRIHPEAEVHPTAVIEGSVVEKGAKVGAYAVVKFSYIGEKAFIDDHAGVKFSVIGKEGYIANNCVMFFSVTYPRVFLISGPYQFSLFGYDSAMMNAIPSDYRFDSKPISVKTSRGVLSTGLRFVGSVIGHRTKIAAGVIIAPGRIVPNDLQILPDPARVIHSIPDGLPKQTPLFLIGGKLTPSAPAPQNDQQRWKNKEKENHERRDFPKSKRSFTGIAGNSQRPDNP